MVTGSKRDVDPLSALYVIIELLDYPASSMDVTARNGPGGSAYPTVGKLPKERN